MITATAQVAKPEGVAITVTLTMSFAEWESVITRLRGQPTARPEVADKVAWILVAACQKVCATVTETMENLGD